MRWIERIVSLSRDSALPFVFVVGFLVAPTTSNADVFGIIGIGLAYGTDTRDPPSPQFGNRNDWQYYCGEVGYRFANNMAVAVAIEHTDHNIDIYIEGPRLDNAGVSSRTSRGIYFRIPVRYGNDWWHLFTEAGISLDWLRSDYPSHDQFDTARKVGIALGVGMIMRHGRAIALTRLRYSNARRLGLSASALCLSIGIGLEI